jgi:carbonic anhydrase/acetyltransferase-like protein (isoleucine patch superfamily)
VGANAVVLYDAAMENGSVLGDLSLLMKGEKLAEGTRWEGTPARAAGTAAAHEGAEEIEPVAA